ncbi:alkylated DNA repair dioxygenase AlkB [Tahibacter aquaticus]|uniref:Alkylated DNA repair dioxygenase AlkB n=1 Tax=Tahibacter aquaticus TaxID=520092 RepID=A0A4V3DML9_9GAMM|nr:alpha-ketoglutarate-dependent dioxygenase AlkB [Tahibacter aquaticus]TDR45036.1 alkylated DNA repair dioxygenase AlkB [Tahibacter aquaticus]
MSGPHERLSQADLFAPAPLLLADDEHGLIRYTPGFLAPGEAAACFDFLHANAAWHGERRQMYEREVDTPRLLASYLLDATLPPLLAALHARVEAAVQARFSHVGLNLYRDERDSVAPHNDHLSELQPGQPIALVSLGATREMVIRQKLPPRRAWHLPLQAGSLLLMSYATQLHYDHGIPKQGSAVGPRISLAFRARSAAPASRGRYARPAGD